jgi:UDP-N-acetylglucosamine--N-acetylmuramyl-(pentapeptide) pyrophosphoryl-undecaprenol N-acetylglucosamine transferase
LTTLLVASTGGHLKQLHALHRRLVGVDEPFRWATFDTPQSRSLLDGHAVDYVPFVGGRDPLNVARNIPGAVRILRRHRVTTLVSTGSAVALPFFTVARALGLRCHYIESAARSGGPSTTGQLISRIPGVRLYAQYPSWAAGRWTYRGSVFDAFEPTDSTRASTTITKVVVSLGTYRGYDFGRLVRRLLAILPADAEVLWQTGDTDMTPFGIAGAYAIPEHELLAAMKRADVVVAHAGVGTALAAFEIGKRPVLVPRRLAHGEHVDDHQIQIAEELAARNLAISVDADRLSYEHLKAAADGGVTTLTDVASFVVA